MRTLYFTFIMLLSLSAVAEEVCLPLLLKRPAIKDGREIPLAPEELSFKVPASDMVVTKVASDRCEVEAARVSKFLTCMGADLHGDTLICHGQLSNIRVNLDGTLADAFILYSPQASSLLMNYADRPQIPMGKLLLKRPAPNREIFFPEAHASALISDKGQSIEVKLKGAQKRTVSCKKVLFTDSQLQCDGSEILSF